MMLDLSGGIPGLTPSVPRCRFRVLFGNDRGELIELSNGEYIVGRHESADVVLNDPAVSRRHFKCIVTDTDTIVEDLGSGNGTKINGVRKPTTKMEHGHQIEIGTSVLRFEDPMRPEDEFAKQQNQQQQVAPTVAAPQVQPAPVYIQQQSKSGNGWVIALLLLILAGGGFVAGEAVFGLYNVMGLAPKKENTASTKRKADQKRVKQAKKLLKRAREAFEAKQWVVCIDLAERAYALNSGLKEANQLVSRAEKEREFSKVIENAKMLKGTPLPEAMKKKLGEIPNTSIYRVEAQELLTKAEQPTEQETAKAIQVALRGKDLEGAQAQLAKLKENFPKSVMLEDFERQVSDLEARAKRIARRKSASRTPRNNPSTSSSSPPKDKEPVRRPVKSSGGDRGLTRGFNLYASGQYDRAIEAFQRVANSSRADDETKSKARRAGKNVTKFQRNYEPGQRALRQYQARKAIQQLTIARKADKKLGGSNQANINPLLAKALLLGAKEDYQRKQYGSSMSKVRRANKLQPNNPESSNLQRKLKGKSKLLFEEATRAKNSGDTARARKLLEQVLSILSAEDSTYKKAKSMRDSL